MKKLLILAILFLSFILLTGCNEPIIPGDNNTLPNTLLIKVDGSFTWEECQERGLQDMVVMLESKYCNHCQTTLPIFREAATEKGIEPLILDLAEENQRTQMALLGVNVQYTPTFIFGCDYFVGAKSKDDYLNMFDTFIEFQNELSKGEVS